MRGIPQKIQTPEDLRNTFELWQDAAWQAQHGAIDTELFIARIDFLCQQQHFRVPILKVDGKTVTTRFFHEVEIGNEAGNGLTVTAFEHFTPPDDLSGNEAEEGASPTCTKITFSGAWPKDEMFLQIKNSCNCLAYNGFDMAEIATMREALQNSLPAAEVK